MKADDSNFLKKLFSKKGGGKGGGYFILSKMLENQNFPVFSALLGHIGPTCGCQ